MLERSTLWLLRTRVQLMSRRLSLPAMGQVEGVIEDAAARCAVEWKASPSARRVCFELPWRGPGPFTFYHRCALVVPAGSRPPQLTSTAGYCLLDGIWAASTEISLLPVVSVSLFALDKCWLMFNGFAHALSCMPMDCPHCIQMVCSLSSTHCISQAGSSHE